MAANNKSEQYRIARFDDSVVDDVDLDALFPVNPNRDAIMAENAAKAGPYLAAIDAETQAWIELENAAVDPHCEKSEQYRMAFIPGPSDLGQ